MNKSKFKIDTDFVLELQYKYSSLLEELHLAQKKQKEFEEKNKALTEVREDARKIINRQRKTIKQLKEKNKALTEVG